MTITHSPRPGAAITSAFVKIVGLAVAGLLFALQSGTASAAENFVNLYSFCAQKPNCTDGSTPEGSLIKDAAGNLYGTTTVGGTTTGGILFEIPAGGSITTLYNFCSLANCADGAHPFSNLVMDTNGNLYGITQYGGAQLQNVSAGIVFELMPNAQRTQWTLQVLHSFCNTLNCMDGETPSNGLTYQGQQNGQLYDGKSPLYGTAQLGGKANSGIAFALSGKMHKMKVLYNFCKKTNCADGSYPGVMIMDGSGDLYGTASGGDTSGDGVFFELSPTQQKYAETVLYQFCQKTNCADGQYPNGSLAMDSSGAIYGTTISGGTQVRNGTVYKLVPKGRHTTESVLYSFCSNGNGCADGWWPEGVVMDPNGNVFGTTLMGGQGFGVVFTLQSGEQSVLRSFCGCMIDGGEPRGGVILDGSGNIFGTTSVGGANDNQGGTVFELTSQRAKH